MVELIMRVGIFCCDRYCLPKSSSIAFTGTMAKFAL